MSKRAEEAALKAYPQYGDNLISQEGYRLMRTIYAEGYEAAQKDTTERAISWLKEHANKYIVDVGVGYGENGRNVELIVGGMCWEHLKKALED